MKIQKNKINWLQNLIDLAVVFIGITAAFMLNSWRETRDEKEQEYRYINGIFRDIELDANNLELIIAQNNAKREKFKSFLESYTQNSASKDSAEVIVFEMANIIPFRPQNSAYESLINSGKLNIISDYELRENIVSYYKDYELLFIKEKLASDYLNSYVVPFIFKNIDITNNKILNKEIIRSLEFKNIIAGYYALLIQNTEAYRASLEQNKKIAQAFKKTLQQHFN